MWELQRFNWAQLRSASSAAGIPAAIEALQTADSDDNARAAYWRIDNEVIVQGLLYEAAVPTACCLIAALVSCTSAARPRIVELLFQLANGQPHPAEEGRGPDDLAVLCRREVLRSAALIFESFEHAQPESMDLWVDLLIVFAEEQEDLAPRVHWYLRRALALDIHDGLREAIQRSLAG